MNILVQSLRAAKKITGRTAAVIGAKVAKRLVTRLLWQRAAFAAVVASVATVLLPTTTNAATNHTHHIPTATKHVQYDRYGQIESPEVLQAWQRMLGLVDDDKGHRYFNGSPTGKNPTFAEQKSITMAMQQWLKDKGLYAGEIDGIKGPLTIKGLQTDLKASGHYKGAVDGVNGPKTAEAERQWLGVKTPPSNVLVYHQATGELQRGNKIIAYGSSGNNDPTDQCHSNQGPITRGLYEIGPPTRWMGGAPNAMNLTRIDGADPCGRNGFVMHNLRFRTHGCLGLPNYYLQHVATLRRRATINLLEVEM